MRCSLKLRFELRIKKFGNHCFKQKLDDLTKGNNCEGTYAYIDNIIIGWKFHEEHDCYVNQSPKTALSLSTIPNVFSTDTLDFLGCRTWNGWLKPDPECVKSPLNLPESGSGKEQWRITGWFAYHAQWSYVHLEKSQTFDPQYQFHTKGWMKPSYSFVS